MNYAKFNKYKRLLFIIVAFAALIFYQRWRPVSNYLSRQNAAASYDYSVKTKYGQPMKVVRVIDGDTIEFVNGERLRYVGIDTPEEVDPKKPVQCFAKEAAAENKFLVEGKSIIFYKDVSDRDKYGRWLGLVYLPDGASVNLSLVKKGFAFAYPYKPDISHADEFKKAETAARKSKLGLWAACEVYRTSAGREQTNAL